MLRTVLLVLGLSVCVAACDNDITSPSDALGTTWKLVSLQETGATTPTPVTGSARYEVTFNENNTIDVTSDCNTCGGTFTLNGTALTIAPLSCTVALCDTTSLDAKFTAVLQASTTMAVDDDGDEMTLTGPAGTLRFED
jgi:heat shock protein HslJ